MTPLKSRNGWTSWSSTVRTASTHPACTAKAPLRAYVLPLPTTRHHSDYRGQQFLAQLNLQGARIDTKNYPTHVGDHEPAKIKATFEESLAALGDNKIRVFYLHAPDRTVPFEDTMEAVNELYLAGHLYVSFRGLQSGCQLMLTVAARSSASATTWPTKWRKLSGSASVAVSCCRRCTQGYITSLTGPQRRSTCLLARLVLKLMQTPVRLFPCLRKFGIKFAAFSVLA